MSLKTVFFWGTISIIAILAVGYADPEWMVRTFIFTAILWVGFFALSRKESSQEILADKVEK